MGWIAVVPTFFYVYLWGYRLLRTYQVEYRVDYRDALAEASGLTVANSLIFIWLGDLGPGIVFLIVVILLFPIIYSLIENENHWTDGVMSLSFCAILLVQAWGLFSLPDTPPRG